MFLARNFIFYCCFSKLSSVPLSEFNETIETKTGSKCPEKVHLLDPKMLQNFQHNNSLFPKRKIEFFHSTYLNYSISYQLSFSCSNFYLLSLQYSKIPRYRTYASAICLDKIKFYHWAKFSKRAAQPWKTYESANNVNFIGQHSYLIVSESCVL